MKSSMASRPVLGWGAFVLVGGAVWGCGGAEQGR